MKNSQALEGHNQFQSGWVSAARHFVTGSGVTILTAAVELSALTDTQLNLTHGLLRRKMVQSFVHIVTLWLGRFPYSFKLFLHLFFLMGKLVLKYITMHAT